MSGKAHKKTKKVNSEDEEEEQKKNSEDEWSNSVNFVKEELPTKKIKKVQAIKTADEIYFNLNSKKRVSVRKYRGQVLIDIREFWEKDNKQLPTKKGQIY